MENDVVVFRRWRDTGDAVALFPEIPADIRGQYCSSYEHIGQHGAADYYGVIQDTTPVGPRECASLRKNSGGSATTSARSSERPGGTTGDGGKSPDIWQWRTPFRPLAKRVACATFTCRAPGNERTQ